MMQVMALFRLGLRRCARTRLTTDPSSDVAPIHDRQMVILERADWSAWLHETGNEGDLLHALPAGLPLYS